MTVILPGARANGGALVGTNLLAVGQFPSGIDQAWIFIDRAGLIAGKPAPTGFASDTTSPITTKNCGSWLASDEAGTDTTNPTAKNDFSHPALAHFPPVS
jgi:hypothetical protein